MQSRLVEPVRNGKNRNSWGCSQGKNVSFDANRFPGYAAAAKTEFTIYGCTALGFVI